MTQPTRRRRGNSVATALYLNAALLLAILVAMLSRPGGIGSGSFLPAAFAAEGQAIAGGGNLYLMPGQMSMSTFGCYVMDTDTQTLCAYQFYPGEKALRLVAARNFRHDRRLGNFNTDPDPRDVEKWVELERNRGRAPAAVPAPAPAQPPESERGAGAEPVGGQ
jgi:hypothetical protein